VYIAGWGRSGSTILGNILGQLDGFAHAGEVRGIWHQLPQESATCGCGARIRECPFWREVLREAFGGVCKVDPDAVRQLRNASTKLRHLPAMYFRGRNARADALGRFLEVSEKFYRAMWRVSGERVLIDSSKVPSYGLAIAMMRGARVRFLHLIRDPRATAYSWSREKYQPDGNVSLSRVSLARSSLFWTTWSAAIEAIRTKADGYLRVRYEDFVAEPERELRRILKFLERPGAPLPFLNEREVFLDPQHTVAGNPDRFLVGRVTIRPDDAWKAAMTTSAKRAVTALTWPLLLRYGYPIRS
jgi:Sulfotransferase family